MCASVPMRTNCSSKENLSSLAAGHDLADFVEHAVDWAELALACGAFPVPEVRERIQPLLIFLRVSALHIASPNFCADKTSTV